MWLAQVGRERIEETIDPELTIDRALETYARLGYDAFRAYFCFYVTPSGHPAVLSDPEFQHGAAEALLYFETPDVSVLCGGKVLKH